MIGALLGGRRDRADAAASSGGRHEVRLFGRVALVSAVGSYQTSYNEKSREYPGVPDAAMVRRQLDDSVRTGGVAAWLETRRGRQGNNSSRLVVRLPGDFKVGMSVSSGGDAFVLDYVSPLSLTDRDRIVKGVMWLLPSGWDMRWDGGFPDKDKPYPHHWPTITKAWQEVTAVRGRAGSGAAPLLSPSQEAFLDTLGELVDLAREFDAAQADSAVRMAYRKRETSGAARHTARPVYVFTAAGRVPFSVRDHVVLDETPGVRGAVQEIAGKRVTVRFDGVVDDDDLPATGSLLPTQSDAQFRVRREAIESMRSGEARNRWLVRVLADRDFSARPDDPPSPSLPAPRPAAGTPEAAAESVWGGVSPDPGQRASLERALTVPTLTLVHGPPGTGKTRTIGAICRASAARREKVLVTSHTHRAVDNVVGALAALPGGPHVVRVGREDAMTSDGRAALLETQALGVRDRIVDQTAPTLDTLAHFAGDDSLATQWYGHLTQKLGEMRTAESEVTQARRAYTERAAEVAAPFEPSLRTAVAAEHRQRKATDRLDRRTDRARGRVGDAGVPARLLPGALRRRLDDRRTRRAARLETELDEARAGHRAAEREVARLEHERDQAVAADPAASAAASRAERAEGRRLTLLAESGDAARVLCDLLTVAGEQVHVERDDAEQVERFAADFGTYWLPCLGDRWALLDEWRTEVSARTEALYPELLRHADVVAATCIGVATSKHLRGSEFDLAVVDEAGQIEVTSLVVPLVRARRAVLVGDHMQLPPFSDRELLDVIRRSSGVAEPPELLTKSMFELLEPSAPADNIAALRLQRRMPLVVAELISGQFYGGRLETRHPGFGPDPVFRSPLAVVDTADDGPSLRGERGGDHRGSTNASKGGTARSARRSRSYDNPREAELAALLALYYAARGEEWAVIVPYQAQAKLVSELLLGGKLGHSLDAETVANNVGIVDSFQGGERDVIIFSFTRSNSACNVGFLTELRRVNVALTRVKRQLVLVGDTTTLLGSRNRQFRDLARALVHYSGDSGDRRSASAVRQELVEAMGLAR